MALWGIVDHRGALPSTCETLLGVTSQRDGGLS